MKKHSISSMQILSSDKRKSKIDEKDADAAHASYQTEVRVYSQIKNGCTERLIKEINGLFENGFGVGRMSSDDLRNTQYWAVCCVTLSIRYAIEGGLDELTAYRFSDECIRQIDNTVSSEEIFNLIIEKAVELTQKVKEAKLCPKYSPYVKACISYINKNLNSRITVSDLAKECHISSDYLSLCFLREVGVNLGQYILKQKLAFAKTLLEEGGKCGEISCSLSFCSQSHFINCFKKEYGVTPKRYVAQIDMG